MLSFNDTRYTEMLSNTDMSTYDVTYPYNYLIIAWYLPLLFFCQTFLRPKFKSPFITLVWFVFNIVLVLYSAKVFDACNGVITYGLNLTNEYNPSHIDTVLTFLGSKYIELADSFFIVFSGKKVGFLHYYHHIMTLLFTLLNYHLFTQSSIFFVWMNSFVHTIMYAYYAASCLGFRFRYKKLITVLQISQMFGGIGFLTWNLTKENAQLPVIYPGLLMYASYAYLFLKFYYENY